MANLGSKILDSGDFFPSLSVTLTNGEESSLPAAVGPGWGVILALRGYW